MHWAGTRIALLTDDVVGADVARRHALRGIAAADDVARMIVFLAGPNAGFVTGGDAVDGGMAAL